MNSSTHKATGFSSAVLLFGHSIDLNRNLISDDSTLSTQDISHNQWVQKVRYMQLFSVGLAKQNLTSSAEVHFENYPSN